MRVLHVYSGNLFGGIESMLVTLARRRRRCPAMEPEFALAFEGRLAAELRQAGAPVHVLPEARLSRPLTVRRARGALAQLVASRGTDCVVCHAAWSQAMFGRTVRQARVPLAFMAHDALSGRHWIERLARRTRPDLAIANSRFTAGTLAAIYPGVPFAVVHPPVDLAAFDRSDADRRAVRQQVRGELATPAEAVVIVQASRMEPWKGHGVLLEALARIRGDRWVAWLAGGAQRPAEAAHVAELRRSVDRLGIGSRVRFLGERDDMPRVLAAADVLCQANLLPEPFGISLVEALASGLPVVTAALGGAVEIVNEACGRLVPADDPDALAAVLEALVADDALRARLARAATARACEISNPDTQLGALHGALASMAAGPVSA